MQIHGLVPIRVCDADHVAFTALESRKQDAAVANGLYRSADGRAVVGSQMRADHFQDWMKPCVAEMRRDRRSELQRRAQKGFLQRFAISGVVTGVAEFVVK